MPWLAPAAGLARTTPASGASAAATGRATAGACAATLETLLAAGAVGARVAALAVVAQRTAARIAGWLVAVSAFRRALVLIETATTGLVLIEAPRARLTGLILAQVAAAILLVEVWLVLLGAGTILLIEIRLVLEALLSIRLVELGLVA